MTILNTIILFLGITIIVLFYEAICYFVGRVALSLFTKNIVIDSFKKGIKNKRTKWNKFTYERDGQKCFYVQTVHLIGTAIVLTTLIALGVIYGETV